MRACNRRTGRMAALGLAAVLAFAGLAAPSGAHASDGGTSTPPANPATPHGAPIPVPDGDGPGRSYVVRVTNGRSVDRVLGNEDVTDLSGDAFSGAVVQLRPQEAAHLRDDHGVRSVEPNRPVVASAESGVGASTTASTWGLDRIDQQTLPLDGDYSPPSQGAGVNVYVIDSGINPSPEFGTRLGQGAYVTDIATGPEDCNGHGTHVAGTIGSSTFGVAPQVTLHSVRVLDCSGVGTTGYLIAGLNWVAENAPQGSVVNMSLGGGYSSALNAATDSLVDSGYVVAVAAGNESDDACGYSPASAPGALTVGATDNLDRATSFSNYGDCLDLYAPGQDITSTSYLGAPSGWTLSGTSMASPHVAGAAAVYRSAYPTTSAAQASAAVLAQATRGVITYPYGRNGSPNLLVNVDFDAPPDAPTGVTATAGDAQATVTWNASPASGSRAITGYSVVSTPSSAGCSTTGATTCTVSGLTNGTSYTFTVAATDTKGMSGPSTASAAVTPSAPTAPPPVTSGPSTPIPTTPTPATPTPTAPSRRPTPSSPGRAAKCAAAKKQLAKAKKSGKKAKIKAAKKAVARTC